MAYIYDEETGEFRTTGTTRVGGSTSGNSSGGTNSGSRRPTGTSGSSGNDNDGCLGGCMTNVLGAVWTVIVYLFKLFIGILIIGFLLNLCT